MNSLSGCLCRAWAVAFGVFTLGCAPADDGAKLLKAEVYYRSFDGLAPVSYTEEELVRSAEEKIVITDASALGELERLLPDHCDADDEARGVALDHYLLVRLSAGDGSDEIFGASRLNYYRTSDGTGGQLICRLNSDDRARIANWIDIKASAL